MKKDRDADHVTGFRYLFYAAFAVATPIVWIFYFNIVLGIMPIGDPGCSFEVGGCPTPNTLRQGLSIASILGVIPITMLVFVFYRRWVRRLIGLDTDQR